MKLAKPIIDKNTSNPGNNLYEWRLPAHCMNTWGTRSLKWRKLLLICDQYLTNIIQNNQTQYCRENNQITWINQSNTLINPTELAYQFKNMCSYVQPHKNTWNWPLITRFKYWAINTSTCNVHSTLKGQWWPLSNKMLTDYSLTKFKFPCLPSSPAKSSLKRTRWHHLPYKEEFTSRSPTVCDDQRYHPHR